MSRVVYSCAPDAPLVDEIARAFASFRDGAASVGVLVFPAGARVSRDLVDPVVAGLRASPLPQLVLVHQNALLGFIASSINLQAVGTRVRSAPSLDAV